VEGVNGLACGAEFDDLVADLDDVGETDFIEAFCEMECLGFCGHFGCACLCGRFRLEHFLMAGTAEIRNFDP
jgi:hypothetical protein